MHRSTSFRAASLVGALAAALPASPASAQTGLIQDAVILAYAGGAVPDASGTPLPGVTFGGSAPHFGNPTLSENGDAFFRGRIVPSAPGQEFALFQGGSPASLVMVLRGGDPMPGVAGATLAALNSNATLSPNGTLHCAVTMSGGGATTANDTAWLGGAPGALALLAREGDLAPGTAGAKLGPLLGSTLNAGRSRNGHMYFKNSLVGGDVSGIANDEAWFAGAPGALELVVREGAIVEGAAAFVLGTSVSQMNDSGQFLYSVTLSTTAGPMPATSASDAITLVHTPGGAGSAVVAREGDPAPGTAGATLGGVQQFSPNAFTTSGRVAFVHTLTGGDVVGTTNSSGLFVRAGGVTTLAVRTGMPAPGTAGAEFASFNASSVRIHDDGAIAFQAVLRGGDVDSTNGEAIFAGPPGSLQLVVRRGQIAPDTLGSTFGPLAAGPMYRADSGRIVFANEIEGHGPGSLSGDSWWYYDPFAAVLLPIWLPNELFTLDMVADVIVDLTTYSAHNNTDSASLPYSHDGDLVGVLHLLSGRTCAFKLRTRLREPVPYCSGDGSATACPCGNAGAAGRGCANNVVPDGARLSGTGQMQISNDTLVFTCAGMPNGSMIVYQGPIQQSGGAGVVFGDGLRCIQPTSIRRFKPKTVVGNMASYPQPGDAKVTVAGAIVAPGTYRYQGWYRSANPTFCTPSTFNLSNGLTVAWEP